MTSSRTAWGTTTSMSGRGSSSRSRRPSFESTISGDALTTRVQRPLQFSFQLLGGNLKSVDFRVSQRLEEASTGQSRDLGALALGDQATIVPEDCGGQAKRTREVLSRRGNLGWQVIRDFNRDRSHGMPPDTIITPGSSSGPARHRPRASHRCPAGRGRRGTGLRPGRKTNHNRYIRSFVSQPPWNQGDPPCSFPPWPRRAAGSDRFWLLEPRVFQTFLDNLRPICSGPGYPTQCAATTSRPRSDRFWLLELRVSRTGTKPLCGRKDEGPARRRWTSATHATHTLFSPSLNEPLHSGNVAVTRRACVGLALLSPRVTSGFPEPPLLPRHSIDVLKQTACRPAASSFLYQTPVQYR